MKKNSVMNIVSLFGVFAVILYFLHVILGKMFYGGYNSLSQAISDLTADNSSSKNIARIFSMFYGIFSVIFSICFFSYYKNKINKFVTIASCVFCTMNVVSFFGYTFFPVSESGYTVIFQDKMHIIVTILVVLFAIIMLVFYGIGFLKTKNYKYLGVISICTLMLLIKGSILINTLPKKYFGVAERINVYSIVVYTGILSLWMHKYLHNSIKLVEKNYEN